MRLVCLPLDDRPVNYDYPRELAAMAGMEIDLPPREWLGNPWRTSRHADLLRWLEETVAGADALVLAVDTLAYGGLIPSRTSTEEPPAVLERLQLLRRLKAARPDLLILASSVILRISRADSAEEEKPYWAHYGQRMFRLSYLEHKVQLDEAGADERAQRDSLRAQIPDDVYDDYRRGRARNHAVNRAMLDWLAEGVFDYLLLPQDDTAEYGWNIAEARTLQSLISARGLGDRAITYPGADEIGCLLLARCACRMAGFAPHVWPRYSSVQGPHVITSYEDRPVHELLKAHLAPLDGFLAADAASADLLLFINAPAEAQGAADLQWLIERQGTEGVSSAGPDPDDVLVRTRREMASPRRSVDEFVRAMGAAAAGGRPVALADVAFVNGADLALGRLLTGSGLAAGLAAFGAWNTAGNTLGTVLAHGLLRALMLRCDSTPGQRSAHVAFLFRRYLDDYFYQTIERTRTACEDLPALGLAPTQARLPDDAAGPVTARVCERLAPDITLLRDLFVRAGLAREVHVTNVHLPWGRLFEIGFDVQVELP